MTPWSRLLEAPGPLLRSPGGPHHGHFEAVDPSCLLLPAGSRGSPRVRNTMVIRVENLRRDRRVFNNLRKIQGLGPFWPKIIDKITTVRLFCIFFRAEASPTKAARRGGTQDPRRRASMFLGSLSLSISLGPFGVLCTPTLSTLTAINRQDRFGSKCVN